MNTSKVIRLKKLSNTRDLGGIRTTDGRKIRENCLIRSGQLFFADPEDLEVLSEMGVSKIYDFRSSVERTEKPDPVIEGAVHFAHPIIRDVMPGITREENAAEKSAEQSTDRILEEIAKRASFATEYMIGTYRMFILDEYAISQYKAFLEDLSHQQDGAVLWHCSAGKDRAGFAAVLVEEILGVDHESILEDYLMTNKCLEDEVAVLIRMLQEKNPALAAAEDGIRDFFSARREYIDTVYALAEENYGGMDGFIRDALKVTDEKKAQMKKLYLE